MKKWIIFTLLKITEISLIGVGVYIFFEIAPMQKVYDFIYGHTPFWGDMIILGICLAALSLYIKPFIKSNIYWAESLSRKK